MKNRNTKANISMQERTCKRARKSLVAVLAISPLSWAAMSFVQGAGTAYAATSWQDLPSLELGVTFDNTPIAVDSSGNLFAIGESGDVLYELPKGASTWSSKWLYEEEPLDAPTGITVDSQGDVFIVVSNLNPSTPSYAVEELSSGSSTWQDITYGGSFGEFQPEQFTPIVVDGSGDVFVLNTGFGTNVVEELPNGSTTWRDIPTPTPLQGISVDSSGNLFGTDGSSLLELPAQGNNTWETVSQAAWGPNFFAPESTFAIDSNGDVFGAAFDYTNNNYVIEELPRGSNTWIDINDGGTFNQELDYAPYITVDNSGDVFVVNSGNYTSDLYKELVTTLPSSDGNLNGLSISNCTLNPAFSSGTTSYTASVGNSVTSIDVTPTLAESHATVTVNGNAVPSGNSLTVPLNVGSNTITVLVTAQDGTTTKSYTVNVTRVPGAPTDVMATSATSNEATVSWKPVTGAKSYNVYEDGSATPIATGVTSTSYPVVGLTPDTQYTFEISAVNDAGESTKSDRANVTTVPVGKIPLNLSKSTVTGGQTVTVTGVVYDVYSNGVSKVPVDITAPEVFFGTPGVTSETVTTDVYGNFTTQWTSPTVTDRTPVTVTASVYGVQAGSATVAVMPPLPGVPTDVKASSSSSNEVTVTWTPVTGAKSYNVYENGNMIPIATALTSPTYNLTGVPPDTTCSFQVSAVNDAGESVRSTPASVTTAAVGDITLTSSANSVTSNQTITLTGVVKDAFGNKIPHVAVSLDASAGYFSTPGTKTQTVSTDANGNLTAQWTSPTVANKTSVTVSASVYGVQGGSATISVLPLLPSVPTDVMASSSSSSGATVTWKAVAGATSYNLYEDGVQAPVAMGVKATSYNVDGLTPGTKYTFKVTSVNDAGESDKSASASVTTLALTVVSPTQTPSTPTTTSPSPSSGKETALSITSPSILGTVQSNQPYAQTLTARGGSGGYTWSITGGTLPTGLSLDSSTGVISGTSNDRTPHMFTVQVTDSQGATQTKQMIIDVLKAGKQEVIWNQSGLYAENVPTFVLNDPGSGSSTTYLPIWYVGRILQSYGIQSVWDSQRWSMTTSKQEVNLNPSHFSGDTGVYLNGHLVDKIDRTEVLDPYSNAKTTYLPAWYLQFLLIRLHVNNTWNGTIWVIH